MCFKKFPHKVGGGKSGIRYQSMGFVITLYYVTVNLEMAEQRLSGYTGGFPKSCNGKDQNLVSNSVQSTTE